MSDDTEVARLTAEVRRRDIAKRIDWKLKLIAANVWSDAKEQQFVKWQLNELKVLRAWLYEWNAAGVDTTEALREVFAGVFATQQARAAAHVLYDGIEAIYVLDPRGIKQF